MIDKEFAMRSDLLRTQSPEDIRERLEKMQAMSLDERRALMGKLEANPLLGSLGAMPSENQCSTAAPKPWAEAPIEEKLERMRGMVKNLNARLAYFETRLGNISQAIAQHGDELLQHRHDHADGGKVMLPAESNQRRNKNYAENGACGQGQTAMDVDPAKVFF